MERFNKGTLLWINVTSCVGDHPYTLMPSVALPRHWYERPLKKSPAEKLGVKITSIDIMFGSIGTYKPIWIASNIYSHLWEREVTSRIDKHIYYIYTPIYDIYIYRYICTIMYIYTGFSEILEVQRTQCTSQGMYLLHDAWFQKTSPHYQPNHSEDLGRLSYLSSSKLESTRPKMSNKREQM